MGLRGVGVEGKKDGNLDGLLASIQLIVMDFRSFPNFFFSSLFCCLFFLFDSVVFSFAFFLTPRLIALSWGELGSWLRMLLQLKSGINTVA